MLWSHLQPALVALQRGLTSADDAGGGETPVPAPSDASAAPAASADACSAEAPPSAAAPPSAKAPSAKAPSAEALKGAMREAFRATEQQLLEQADDG